MNRTDDRRTTKITTQRHFRNVKGSAEVEMHFKYLLEQDAVRKHQGEVEDVRKGILSCSGIVVTAAVDNDTNQRRHQTQQQ